QRWQANAHYERALELIRTRQPGAREELLRGKALGPMNPSLYLPLARACRAQDNGFLAVQYYRSYLAAFPSPTPSEPEVTAAQKELAELQRELGEVFGSPLPEWSANSGLLSKVPPAALLSIGTALGLLLAAAILGLFSLSQRRSRQLANLAEAYPEL